MNIQPSKRSVHPIAAPPRLTDVMSRVCLDLTPLLHGHGTTAFASASTICRHCLNAPACDQWNSQREQGEAHEVPAFCPAMAFLMSSLRQ